MISQHNEIEAKLLADGVQVPDFLEKMNALPFVKDYQRIEGPDDYYECGEAVVRHRLYLRDGGHELTVKRRKSAASTRDREEIDLAFAAKTSREDVEAFLGATGYAKAFRLHKVAHVFWVSPTPNITLSYALYDVWHGQGALALDKPSQVRAHGPVRRFVEVEAEKGSAVSPETGKRYVREAVLWLRETFGLGEPVNESLWEIFSSKRYSLIGDQ